MSTLGSRRSHGRFAAVQSLLTGRRQRPAGGQYLGRRAERHLSFSPCLERLEDRTLLSLSFSSTNYPAGVPPFSAPLSVAVGDLRQSQGNTNLDIITANSGQNTVSVLLGNGNGTFLPAVQYPVGAAPDFVAVGDLRGVGKLDIVATNSLPLSGSLDLC